MMGVKSVNNVRGMYCSGIWTAYMPPLPLNNYTV